MSNTVTILNNEQAQILLCEKVLNNPWIEKTFEKRILQYVKENKSWNFIRVYIDDCINVLEEFHYDQEVIDAYREVEDLVFYIIDELDD